MFKQLRIVQSDQGFKFGMDAVLLAAFARLKGTKVLDLCAGTGIVSLLMAGRHEQADITALEILPEMTELTRMSIELNHLEDRVHAMCADLRTYTDCISHQYYDTVTVNPPYTPVQLGQAAESEKQNIARHEASCTLDDVISAAVYALKFGGRLAMIIRADRTCDAICAMREHSIEPKRARLVCPRPAEKPNLLLLEGVKGGKPTLVWETPLTIYNEEGAYTPEMQEIYHLR